MRASVADSPREQSRSPSALLSPKYRRCGKVCSMKYLTDDDLQWKSKMPGSHAGQIDSLRASPPNRRIKLVFLIRSLGIGGAERQLVELAKGLDRKAFDVT